MFTPEEGAAYQETRAALVTLANTAVPFDLDPTMANNTSRRDQPVPPGVPGRARRPRTTGARRCPAA